jgi:subtilisin family serine protease
MPDNPSLTVALSGTGTLPPSAALAPSSFTVSLAPGQAPADRTSTLSNSGGDNLNWRIASVQQTGSPLPSSAAAPAASPPGVRTDLIYAEDNYSHAYAPGKVIVGFKAGQAAFASSQAAAALGIKEMRELALAIDPKTGLKANTGRKVVLLSLQAANGVRQAIDMLRQDANVAFAEPDYIQKAIAIPNDPSFGQLYGMHNTGQNGGAVDADIDAPEAWDRHTGNRSILIGVIDTGIDYMHPDLAANIWTNPGEIAGNGIDDDHNGFVDDVHGWDFAYDDNNPTDGHYHGTHVSGTIAAIGNNGVGVAGVMWTASLVALKFLDDGGSGTTSDAIDAVNYANAMGIRITSNSWGGGGFSQALMDAIGAGGLFVAAAGNNGTDNDASPQYPASYTLSNIISVAATDNLDGMASFSCFGHTSVDLGAPGVNTYSLAPGGGYQSLSGTSMATPHVSGVAGLVWTANPGMSAAQVKAAILASTDPIPALNGRTVTGGRLNARKALEAAGPNWLRAAPLTPGILAPGASAPITVTVDPAGLAAGRWTGVVNVATDDPAHAVLPISVTADIAGCRSLAVEPAAYDFGDRLVGSVTRADLALRNACNDTVTVSAAASSDPAFALAAVLPIKIPPFQVLTVRAEFRPAAAGPVTGTLTLTSNADADPVKSVALLGRALVPPFATATPANVSRTLAPGATTVVDLDIGNTGGSDLLWTLSNVGRGFASQAPYDASHFALQEKGAPDTRVGRPVAEASGGPDAFGYRWTDSDESGGPAYQWQDISATGTLVLSGCDDCYATKPLSFSFPLYGTRFSQVNLTTNGYVNFGAVTAQYANYPLPSTSMPTNLVAAFFDDLNTSTGGVYFQDFGDRAVIQYQNVAYYSGSGNVTFQIVLRQDGEIDFYYENMTGSVLSATTGIQDGSGAVGTQVQYNAAYIRNHLAVRFRTVPAWLRASALSGTVPSGGSQRLALTLDAGALVPGSYSQVMTLSSNNPSQAPIQIPVDLTVSGAGAAGVSRVLRVGPSALAAAAGSRYYLWNLTVGGEARGLARGSRYTLYLK